MSKINAVCVYCGSSAGSDPAYVKAAEVLGKSLAQNGVRLVYGGGSVGIMGAVARAVLEHGGDATGIIPEFLFRKERPQGLRENLIVTRDMHERKQKMFEAADAFVALPGGIGTLEELVEQLTWVQIGQHKKPVLLANINGFWEPLRDLLDHMERLGFIYSGLNGNLLTANRPEDILPKLREAARAVAKEDVGMAVPAEKL
ncbi:MAG TPA: TIGR00730 family Rossman fold protein [Xanthobacteraceae bacterium]|nr:TIGR00730 family Rossman fold protein [Xanthobacteraceae bacterium]